MIREMNKALLKAYLKAQLKHKHYIHANFLILAQHTQQTTRVIKCHNKNCGKSFQKTSQDYTLDNASKYTAFTMPAPQLVLSHVDNKSNCFAPLQCELITEN